MSGGPPHGLPPRGLPPRGMPPGGMMMMPPGGPPPMGMGMPPPMGMPPGGGGFFPPPRGPTPGMGGPPPGGGAPAGGTAAPAGTVAAATAAGATAAAAAAAPTAASGAPGTGGAGESVAADAPPGSESEAPGSEVDTGGAAEVDLSAAGALSQTIYVNNLPEKGSALELKRSLYAVFKRFGKIVDIHARKTYFLRGQAWVVFETMEAAKNAVLQMQGFPLFDKKMRIAFATATSDAVAKKQGTYQKRPKRKRVVPPPSLEAVEKKAKGDGGNDKKPTASDQDASTPAVATATAAPAATAAAAAPAAGAVLAASVAAQPAPGVAVGSGAPQQQRPAPPLPPPVYVPPNKQLLATQLPSECTKEMLEELFKKFPNFKSLRFFSVKHAAFIEYTDIHSATVALRALQNFKLSTEHTLNLTYAK